MRRVAERLAEWHRLVKDLEDVRARLKSTPAGPERKRLNAEARRLKNETDLALDAVSAAIAGAHLSASDLEDGTTRLPVGGVGHGSSNWSQRRKGPLH